MSGIPGYPIGAREQSGWPFDSSWWDKTGGVYFEIFNAYTKEAMVWAPPAPWIVLSSDRGYDVEAEMNAAGPPQVPDFLAGIRFKRDYIGNELKELQERKLEAPEYEIEMLTEE